MLSRQLTLGQALSLVVTVFTVLGGTIIEMKVESAKMETKHNELEARLQEVKETEADHYKELKNSNQAIYDKLVEIQVQLQNKEDRK